MEHAHADPAELPDDPAELKRIIADQRLEIELMRAVVEVVKKDPRVDPSALSGREKTMVIEKGKILDERIIAYRKEMGL